MRKFGFSTGALAYGDYERGLSLQKSFCATAVELSALREDEVAPLVNALPNLDLASFEYVSFHAPSSLRSMSEHELVKYLHAVAEREIPIVLHPDVISDVHLWQPIQRHLLLENMDRRKRCCRTAAEMLQFFNVLPHAKFCFDIAHARQVDPTMSVALEFILEFGDRLAEVHVSEVNDKCQHVAISTAAVLAFEKLTPMIPPSVPVVIESVVPPDQVAYEFATALNCFKTWEYKGGTGSDLTTGSCVRSLAAT